MRHRRKTNKLQRDAAHRKSMLANQVCSLIKYGGIKTTLAKAKAVRPIAEKMLTFGKRGDVHARRQVFAFLRDKDSVKKLFTEIAPAAMNRAGGYCRIIKLQQRMSDAAPMAYIEWVDKIAEEETSATTDTESNEQNATTADNTAENSVATESK